jgi:hypothetical protein
MSTKDAARAAMQAQNRALQEKRTNLAIRKNLMGSPGKLGVIAKWLGQPIVRQSFYASDTVYEDENGILTAEDENLYLEGYCFDGLSGGLHLEIRFMLYDGHISVSYKGYPVYIETAGDLEAYAPFSEWEEQVDRLYKQALLRKQKNQQQEAVEEQGELKKEQKSFLQMLRLRWGI